MDVEITESAVWTASSSKNDFPVSALFDHNTETCWQSDGRLPHYLLAQFPRQTFISRIEMYLAFHQDDTYIPVELAISIGSDPYCLTEIKKEYPQEQPNWVSIDVNVSTIFLKISILQNFNTGCNSRIRLLRVFGSHERPHDDPNVSFITPMATQYLAIH